MLNVLVLSSLFLGSLAIFDVEVLEEQDVYTLTPPNNGSGPLWSGGCTSIASIGEDVYIGEMQTGAGVPLLCNTRWRLLRRTPDGFKCIAEPEGYRQREPCSLAVAGGKLFMYVNDSTTPPGTMYGACEPHLLKFKLDEPVTYEKLMPKWAGEHTFTDHSYRGYAADSAAGRLLMLNIDAKTSVQNACMLDDSGEMLATGSITFPIRACYPQVAVVGDAVHVVAVGDIVEPVDEWRNFKFEKIQREWDYVFRTLYYARTPNLREQDFGTPLEIANVDKTGGYISNKDLWVDKDGAAWILYTEQEVQSPLLRDRFFPGKSVVPSLYVAHVQDNQVSRREILAGTDDRYPAEARFQILPDGTPFIVVYIGGAAPGVYLAPLILEEPPLLIPLKHPMASFSLASVRAGNAPSDVIHIFGNREGNIYSYARVKINFSV